MPSIQVTILDQVEDEMAIETEYDISQLRMLSMSSEQVSVEDQDVVAELPTSRVRHVDDEDWEVSSKSKRYVTRLKEAKIQRLRAQHWNDYRLKTTTPTITTNTEERGTVEKNDSPNNMIGERPFDEEQPEEDHTKNHPDTPKSLFSPSTMSDSESLVEEEKQKKNERYQRMINDPYAFSEYDDDDVIPQVVVVDNKSSKSGDHVANKAEEDDESAAVENVPSEDSWDMLNKYDENAANDEQNDNATSKSLGRTPSPSVDQPMPEKASTKSKDEMDLAASGDELMGVGYVDDEIMNPKPSSIEAPSLKTLKSEDKNNDVLGLDSTTEKFDFGEEPEPSFGNILYTPCDEELQVTKTTETKETVETEEVSEAQVELEEQLEEVPDTKAKETTASQEKVDPLPNDFPEQSVLELLMKRAEKNAKKQASEKEPSKEESESKEQPTLIEESAEKIEKDSPLEEAASTSDALPQEDQVPTETQDLVGASFPSEASVGEKNFNVRASNTESSKALLDNALQMIARLQKENAEKDDRLRSSDLYVQSLEKKLFEEKSAMQEERKRRANMDSEQVSALEDKVSDTLNKLSCEEGKSKAFQQLVNDLKEELRVEKFRVDKNQEYYITTKTLLEREQSQVKQLQNDLVERDQTLEDTKNRVQELKEQLALANTRASQEHSRATELQAALSEKESGLEKTELKLVHTNVQLQSFMDGKNASEEIKRNEEMMEKLKQSIESREQLIAEEEAKKKEILSKQLENVSLAEDHQASAKKVEESLEKYYQLMQKEKEEVQRLKQLGKERQEEIANEQSLVKELEATVVRKNAMVALEKVKQQALASSIAQKARLVDIETAKMREHKAICAERMRQIEEEKETIRLAIQDKEELLCSEKAAIEYLQKTINTKKTLREERKAWEKAISSGYGVEPPKRGSGIWTNYAEAEEQKVILQELGKLRSSHYGSK